MTTPAARIPCRAPTATPSTAAAAAEPSDEVQKHAIADAVWTDLLWLMPPGRTVTVTVRDGNVAVDIGPPGATARPTSH